MHVIEHTLDDVPDELLAMLVTWALAQMEEGAQS